MATQRLKGLSSGFVRVVVYGKVGLESGDHGWVVHKPWAQRTMGTRPLCYFWINLFLLFTNNHTKFKPLHKSIETYMNYVWRYGGCGWESWVIVFPCQLI